jgi:hypothetical protein
MHWWPESDDQWETKDEHPKQYRPLIGKDRHPRGTLGDDAWQELAVELGPPNNPAPTRPARKENGTAVKRLPTRFFPFFSVFLPRKHLEVPFGIGLILHVSALPGAEELAGLAKSKRCRVVSILFWNLAGNPAILPHLRCLGRNRSVDIFLLAESPADLGAAVEGLNTLRRGIYREAGRVRPKVRVLTRLAPPEFDHLFTTIGGETGIWSIRAPKLIPSEVLLATTHLPAKVGGHTAAAQAQDAGDVAAELAEFEDGRNHRNTVFVGDFNMNPYDPGMTLVMGVHGLMTAQLARKGDRLYRKRRYRRFYNPMWGFFGDRTHGPAGTHFWRSAQPHNTHWAMFDQVLLRPALINSLAHLEILENDGQHSLLAVDGAPDKAHLSDHLPIIFQLDV